MSPQHAEIGKTIESLNEEALLIHGGEEVSNYLEEFNNKDSYYKVC